MYNYQFRNVKNIIWNNATLNWYKILVSFKLLKISTKYLCYKAPDSGISDKWLELLRIGYIVIRGVLAW